MSSARISRNDPCPCGSGKKFKHCCHRNSFDKGMPYSQKAATDGAVLTHRDASRQAPSPRLKPITRVGIDYTIADALAKAEVSFSYELGTPIILADGNALPVECLQAGAQFRLEDGGLATVTKVDDAKVWEPPSQQRDANANEFRRVIGRVKYTGLLARLDIRVPGDVIETTPGHPFYSDTRRGWFPAESFQQGEMLLNRQGLPVRVEWISPVRWESSELYNFEVEDYHTYFVSGSGASGIWSHNGLGGGCRVPRASERDAPRWANSPETGGVKGHAAKHGGVGSIPSKPSAYYNHALENVRSGTPYRYYHDGQFKTGYVTEAGNGRYVFTGASRNGRTIFTHMEVRLQYLNRLGITLKGG